jgi:hypothetical protein
MSITPVDTQSEGAAAGGDTSANNQPKARSAPPPPPPEDAHDEAEGEREWFYFPKSKEFYTTNSRGDWVSVDASTARQMLIRDGVSDSLTKEERLAGVKLTEVDLRLIDIRLENTVRYVGTVAGWKRGKWRMNGKEVLVTEELSVIAPRPPREDAPARADGSCRGWPVLGGQFERWLSSKRMGLTKEGAWLRVPEGEKPPAGWRAEDEGHDQRPYYFAWLARWYRAILDGTRELGHAVVFAGGTGCGKTLNVQLLERIFGGESAEPYKYLTGGQFNKDLATATVMTIDDEVSKTDMKSRKDIGAHVKQFVAKPKMRVEGKGSDAVILSPCNRLIFCVNLTADNLSVLPPPSEDLVDADGKSGKMQLYKFYAHGWEMPFDTEAAKAAFFKQMIAELPYFLWWLLNEFQLPAELHDDRFGVVPWMHPEILESLEELSPWQRILGLIDRELFKEGGRNRWVVTAEKLHQLLTDEDSKLPAYEKQGLKANYLHLSDIAIKRPHRCVDVRSVARGKIRAYALFRDGEDHRSDEAKAWIRQEVESLLAAKGGAPADALGEE